MLEIWEAMAPLGYAYRYVHIKKKKNFSQITTLDYKSLD